MRGKQPYVLYFVAVFCLLLSAGCASLTEAVKGFAGLSTKVLEEKRSEALSTMCPSDYFSCYTTTLDILKKEKCYVYAQGIKRHMIAVYVSQSDTTPVGVFFTEADKAVKVEVSSASTVAKETIAGKLFLALEKAFPAEVK